MKGKFGFINLYYVKDFLSDLSDGNLNFLYDIMKLDKELIKELIQEEAKKRGFQK